MYKRQPYGYRKSEEDHHQLIVDEEAAEHLKSIFSMYMDGRNYSDIAKQLNKDGVLSPTLQRKFYKTGEKPLPESKPWNNTSRSTPLLPASFITYLRITPGSIPLLTGGVTSLSS